MAWTRPGKEEKWTWVHNAPERQDMETARGRGSALDRGEAVH